MAAPPNWRGEFRGFDDDDVSPSGGRPRADDPLNRSTSKFRDRDKDKEWEGDPARFSCLVSLRHGTGREQRYGPRFRMLGCCYNNDGTQICTASEDKTCRIFDRISQKPLHKFIHNELVRCASISHSGRYVCTGCDDQHCRMLPLFPEEDHPELKKGEEFYYLHHAGWLTSITFAQYDRLLLTTARDRVARIWDIGNMDLRMPTTKWKLEDPIHHACFSPDQTRVAFASGAQRYFGLLSVFHTERGQVDGGGHQINPPLCALEHPDAVTCVAFSPNNRYMGSACLDGEARVFDTRIFDHVASFKHPNFIRTISFTQCNKCICTACEDGCIRIFNIALRKELQCFQTGEPLTWSVLAPGGLEVCCTTSEGQLQIWGVEGRISRRLKEHMRSLEGSLEVAKDWEARKAARQTEQLALQDTIKMLNSDESLDLFRKRSTALLQLSSNRQKVRKALALVKAAKAKDSSHPELNFLALALSGKKADFSKILEKIDGMVALLKQEAEDDKTKKDYCNKEFRSNADKSKALDSKITTLKAGVAEKKDAIAKLAEDVVGLQSGVKALDESVATAGTNRQSEHADFQESSASNSAALDLLSMARDRLNKVYNPSMVAATTTKSPYDLSLLQIKGEQPPPTFEGGYQQKTQESNGVLKMIDTLSSDIDKEMAMAKTEEADAQADYEETLKDAAEKRKADMALVAQKTQDKADIETDLNDEKADMKGKKKELQAASKFAVDLHEECDWLLKNFDLRAEARTEMEKENLIRAKTVLSGM